MDKIVDSTNLIKHFKQAANSNAVCLEMLFNHDKLQQVTNKKRELNSFCLRSDLEVSVDCVLVTSVQNSPTYWSVNSSFLVQYTNELVCLKTYT